jgi:hypothetical protein
MKDLRVERSKKKEQEERKERKEKEEKKSEKFPVQRDNADKQILNQFYVNKMARDANWKMKRWRDKAWGKRGRRRWRQRRGEGRRNGIGEFDDQGGDNG